MYVQAAAAGLTPPEVDEMTLGELGIVLEGYAERERTSLLGRINAILRAFSKKDSPYKGLGVDTNQRAPLSWKEAARRWLWQDHSEE